jgi:hypothetical protein
MTDPIQMTDWRERCAELAEALCGYTLSQDDCLLVDRTHAELAQSVADATQPTQPEPEGVPPRVGHILRLAEIIREVDGNHDKGAAALAEAILSHSGSRWSPAIEPVPGELEELVRRLRDWHSIPLLEERERIATLLQQQQHLLGLACAELDAFMEQQSAPAPVPVTVAERLIGVTAQREEILRAFVAKYGCGPEEAIQVFQAGPTGFKFWVEKQTSPDHHLEPGL